MMLKTIEVRGREFEVSIDDRDGMFSTTVDGSRVQAESLAELADKLAKATKAVKVAVQFATLHERKVMIGTCTGKHASNSNYLVRWANGKSEQVGGWDLEKRCVDPAFAEEYQSLEELVQIAVGKRTAFEAAHGINVRATVDAELENAWRSELRQTLNGGGGK